MLSFRSEAIRGIGKEGKRGPIGAAAGSKTQ
jgi:hypothetical protein